MDYRMMTTGWPTVGELEWLAERSAELAAQFGDITTLVHIGVERGVSLHASYAGAPGAHIIGVDPDCSQWQGEWRADLKEMTSLEAAAAVTTKVHLLFVDGDHSAEAVTSDLKVWTRKMANNGIVAVHDYGNSHLLWCAGVKAAVDAWNWAGWQLLDAPDSIRAYRKIGK